MDDDSPKFGERFIIAVRADSLEEARIAAEGRYAEVSEGKEYTFAAPEALTDPKVREAVTRRLGHGDYYAFAATAVRR